MRLSLFIGLRLMTLNTTNLGASTPFSEGGKSLRIPIERTCKVKAPYMDSASQICERPRTRPTKPEASHASLLCQKCVKEPLLASVQCSLLRSRRTRQSPCRSHYG